MDEAESDVPFATQAVSRGDQVAEESAPSASHECEHCHRRYSRADHLKRHSRTHDDERIYQCHLCSRGFHRRDLLARHQLVHERSPETLTAGIKRGRRARKACERCVAAKTRCSGDNPCSRCQRRQLKCNFVAQYAWQNSPPASNDTRDMETSGLEEPIVRVDLAQLPAPPGYGGLDLTVPEGAATDHVVGDIMFAVPSSSNDFSWDDYAMLVDTSAFQTELDMLPETNDFSALSKWTTPTMLVSRDTLSQLPAGDGDAATHLNLSSPTRESVRHAAFERSAWNWSPTSGDSGGDEEMPRFSSAETQKLRDASLAQDFQTLPRAISKDCGTSLRDSMLFLVQLHTDPSLRLPVPSFPTSEALSLLIQRFLAREALSVCPLIHVASFSPDICRVELSCAMIASTASSLGDRHIAQMGLALQERTRLAAIKAMDSDSSLIRNLNIMQAFVLWIETGLWSGVRRKMEIAEAAANNVPTMVRRAGACRNYEIDQPSISADDEGPVLTEKWLTWIEMEAFKRLLFRAFVSDMQASIAYLRAPCFYSADLKHFFPASQDLWAAQSAAEWRNVLLAKSALPHKPRLSIAAVMNDGTILAFAGSMCDTSLCAFIAVHGIWTQVSSYLDSKAAFRYQPSPNSRTWMWLEAQRQDLCSKIIKLRQATQQLHLQSANTRIICEYLLMALYASPKDMSTVAGRFGEVEARAMLTHLQSWSKGEEYRYAIWHAGQTLRIAQSMEPGKVEGFFATIVYQASLTLLMASVTSTLSLGTQISGPLADVNGLHESLSDPAHPLSACSKRTIVLNGVENGDVENYLRLGLGVPSLQVSEGIRPLAHPYCISQYMSFIYENNRHGNSVLPRLSEGLSILIRDLSKAT